MDRPPQPPAPPATPAPRYTAAQIATALGIGKRAVLLAAADCPPSANLAVPGGPAKAWTLAALPAPLRTRLETQAIAQHFPDADSLLRHRSQAARRAGILPAGLPGVPPGSTTPAPSTDLHIDLADAFADYLTDRKTLSRADHEWLWAETLRHYQALSAVAPEAARPALKTSLLNFLLSAVPGIVKPGKSPRRTLARSFDRKLAKFTAGGRPALRDGRETKSGNWRASLCPGCWNKLVALAVQFGGNKSLAWREFKTSGDMCPDCASRHRLNLRHGKSYVPHSIRAAVTPLADAALPWVKSDAAGRMAGPYIPRDWSDTAPGDFFCGDDVTWNHKVYDYDPQGRVVLFRPECLYLADERTSFPLCHLLIAGHYTGRHVRQAMLHTHDQYGLPHYGFKFENGVWRCRVVRDQPCDGDFDFRETEDGFKTMGMLFQLRHAQARNPRSKVVEGDFKILQQAMRREAGFVGFNQRAEQSDTEKDFERRVLSGKEHPGNGFCSFADWSKRLADIFDKFANAPQNGARNPGLSPAESWRAGMATRALRKLPDDARWILATHRQLKKVTSRGLVIEFGKNIKWTYAGEQLARYIGRHVWTYYHFDFPELLTVQDEKRTTTFSVKGVRLPANWATASRLNESHAEITAFNRLPKAIASIAKNRVVNTITHDGDFTPAETAFGRHMKTAKAGHIEATTRATDARTRSHNDAASRLQELWTLPDAPATAQGSP